MIEKLTEIHTILKEGKFRQVRPLLDAINVNEMSNFDLSFYYVLESWYYYDSGDYKLSREYSEKTIKIAKDVINSIRAYIMLFNTEMIVGNIEEGERIIERMLPLLEDPFLDNDKKIEYQRHLYSNLSFVHSTKWEFDKALNYSLKSLKLLEELGEEYKKENLVKWGFDYNGVGYIYYRLNQLDKAELYIKKALEFLVNVNEISYLINPYLDLVNIAMKKGELHNVKKNMEIVLSYLKEEEKLNTYTKVLAFTFAVRLYFSLDDFPRALLYMEKATSIIDDLEDPYLKALTYKDKVVLLCHENKLTEAKSYLERIISLSSNKTEENISHIKDYTRSLFLFHNKQHLESLELFKEVLSQAERLRSDLDSSIKLYIVEILLELSFDITYEQNVYDEIDIINSYLDNLTEMNIYNTYAVKDKMYIVRAKIEKFHLNFDKAEEYLFTALNLAKESNHSSIIPKIEEEIKKVKSLFKMNLETKVDVNHLWQNEKKSIADYFREIQRIAKMTG
ncbi:MAG: hypothetical protein ACW981_02565 [Candidatus Hodarchaeales archaeon]|jgi:tetratricopeptide (TPR) repeat protein